MATSSAPRGSKGPRESRSPSVEAGVVKGIISGSTIQVIRASASDKTSGRGPTEYEISLQGIRAPLGGGKDRNEEVCLNRMCRSGGTKTDFECEGLFSLRKSG